MYEVICQKVIIKKNLFYFSFIVLLIFLINGGISYQNASGQNISSTKTLHWEVDGLTREAMVYIPESAESIASPIVFVFHGHGGTMRHVMASRRLERLWPEAIIVYPQGLNTPGQLTDKDGQRPGWQKGPGDMNDRDLHFFDAMLKSFRTDFKINNRRVYATGHSNGGGFTYLLWATRGDQFAAFAPSAAVAGRIVSLLKPKPAIHIMGEQDPLVKPQWQKLMCKQIMRINDCEQSGKPYGDRATLYPSKTGNPFVLYSHPGDHTYPSMADEVVANFFKTINKP